MDHYGKWMKVGNRLLRLNHGCGDFLFFLFAGIQFHWHWHGLVSFVLTGPEIHVHPVSIRRVGRALHPESPSVLIWRNRAAG